MTEKYEKELFGLRCGDLIETIRAVLKFKLEDWQRHRLETLRAELVSNKGVFAEDRAEAGAAQDGTLRDAETMFKALVSIETRLRVLNTEGMIEPQKEWIKETRRIALDALGKLEKEGK